MRHFLLLLLLGFAITFTSCRDDFDFEPSTGGLEFSRDTVYLDTVFTNIGSSTYTLKVYNRSNKDIKIPGIQLGDGENSKYRLMVDGVTGKVFNDVELLAKDSMFVFIETTIDYSEYANNTTTFLYTDNIQFSSTTGTQKVELVTLVQDAYFLYPQRFDEGYEAIHYNDTTDIYGFELNQNDHDDEYHWNNSKPYVVYGFAAVPSGKTLNIDPGARAYFHANSGLLVQQGGTLNINGTPSSTENLEKEVIFEGDRLEPDFADIAGQWFGVIIMSGTDNNINHLTLKNATLGIWLQPKNLAANPIVSPKLNITNSQLYNCANFGILAEAATITGENLVANNAGEASVSLLLGGNYDFKYSTFANYSTAYNQRPLDLMDYYVSGNTTYTSSLTANFDNCIIYGSGNLGVNIDRKGDANNLQLRFNKCLIKIVDTYGQLNTLDYYNGTANKPAVADYSSSLIAANSSQQNPKFVDAKNNDLHIITGDSAADGAAGSVTTQFSTDVTGLSRTTPTDIGAYESIVSPPE